jgi:hypothetical protein
MSCANVGRCGHLRARSADIGADVAWYADIGGHRHIYKKLPWSALNPLR